MTLRRTSVAGVLLLTGLAVGAMPAGAQPMTRTWSDFTGPMTLFGRDRAEATPDKAAGRRIPVFSLQASTTYRDSKSVAVLLTGRDAARDSVFEALATAPDAPRRQLLREFVTIYAAMGPEPTASRVGSAIRAFNRLIQSCSSAFLETPPDELRALRAVMLELRTAAATPAR